MNKFEDDKQYKKGLKGENLILKQIQKKYPNAKKIDGYFKDYDIQIPEIQKTVEIKTDFTTSTGNVFIEFTCNKKPSGILTTRADIWVYILESKKFWIKTDNLKKCINKHNCLNLVCNKNILGKDIQGFLIPLYIFQEYCFDIKDLTEEESCQLN